MKTRIYAAPAVKGLKLTTCNFYLHGIEAWFMFKITEYPCGLPPPPQKKKYIDV